MSRVARACVCELHALWGGMLHATNEQRASNMDPPSRWLMKNTDTFAGFAHAMNSYLAGVALAARHGIALMHRPQVMAHGLGFAFVDFFDSDPRGVIPLYQRRSLRCQCNADQWSSNSTLCAAGFFCKLKHRSKST